MSERASNIEKPLSDHLRRGSTPLTERIQIHNQFILHNYTVPVEKSCACPHPGCGGIFSITLYPNQIVYPKYCEEHRTAHRRGLAA